MIWHIGSCIGIFALAVLRLSVMETLFVVTTYQSSRAYTAWDPLHPFHAGHRCRCRSGLNMVHTIRSTGDS